MREHVAEASEENSVRTTNEHVSKPTLTILANIQGVRQEICDHNFKVIWKCSGQVIEMFFALATGEKS